MRRALHTTRGLLHVKELPWVKPRPSITSRNHSKNRSPKQNPNSSASNHAESTKEEERKDELKDKLNGILDTLPKAEFAFGYGSGVFPQDGLKSDKEVRETHETDERLMEYPFARGFLLMSLLRPSPPFFSLFAVAQPQIDFILAVDDVTSFHAANMSQNPSHYSSLPLLLGPSPTSRFTSLGPGLYFNPYCPINSSSVKYGVLSTRSLLSDLETWSSLYASGRMHKPINVLKPSPPISKSQSKNLKMALSCALLTSSEFEKSWGDLFMGVSNISYSGDLRMSIKAEDPDKVNKIVNSKGQVEKFRDLYTPHLRELEAEGVLQINEGGVEGDESAGGALREKLPER